ARGRLVEANDEVIASFFEAGFELIAQSDVERQLVINTEIVMQIRRIIVHEGVELSAGLQRPAGGIAEQQAGSVRTRAVVGSGRALASKGVVENELARRSGQVDKVDVYLSIVEPGLEAMPPHELGGTGKEVLRVKDALR